MIKTAVVGAAGRMGRMLVREVAAAEQLELVGAVEASGAPSIGQDAGTLAGLGHLGVAISDDLARVVAAAEVVIEFTAPEVTARAAALCAEHATALVSGTTALGDAEHAALEQAATKVAVVWAPNMSVGVNVLLRLVAEATRLLGSGYDIEIVEAHHRQKKDAPSGTARRLAEVIVEQTAEVGDLDQRARHGREGLCARGADEIGIHAVRGGDIVGEHTVLFATEGERVELGHRASSRQTFTRGGVRAAAWVTEQPPGLYDMQHVLGLAG